MSDTQGTVPGHLALTANGACIYEFYRIIANKNTILHGCRYHHPYPLVTVPLCSAQREQAKKKKMPISFSPWTGLNYIL